MVSPHMTGPKPVQNLRRPVVDRETTTLVEFVGAIIESALRHVWFRTEDYRTRRHLKRIQETKEEVEVVEEEGEEEEEEANVARADT
uniref:Uncharacterized protein n=1 Tax=Vespula pensylvanica TaxID=30213 RepID=A0A834N720_VESPE|nr:hypothetical protein H0235_016113 [Vespula pensylvanica]